MMPALPKDNMDVILSVLTIEEFEEYQSLLETKIYHTTLTIDEETRIQELSARLAVGVKRFKNIQ